VLGKELGGEGLATSNEEGKTYMGSSLELCAPPVHASDDGRMLMRPMPNPDIYPTTQNSKTIRRNANAPTVEHRNKWKNARNIKGTVLGDTILPFPSLRAIIFLESGVEPDKKVYQITISHFPKCTYLDFLNMAMVSIGKRGQYVNCKHFYYIFHYFYKMNCEGDKFIHSPSFSFNEVKQLLV
jgi:hypothetical protein